MIKNKKGLSEIVTTVIIVLLVLVAVGILWAVVGNMLQGNVDTIDSDKGLYCTRIRENFQL